MTHIDPFAPGDSPQHPANWVDPCMLSVQNAIADTYQWRRDHFAMASESDRDIAPEELEERHERYASYLEAYGAPEEASPDSDFVPLPVLLRREVFSNMDDEQMDEWKQLFEEHATDDERDPQWVEDVLPDLDELQTRASVSEKPETVTAPADQTQTGTPVPEILLTAPKGNALKEEWVEYALAVEKARGGTLTFEQADAMTKDELKAAYKPQAS